jgi:hypothetical protein
MKTANLNLLAFLNELRQGKIYYRLSQHRANAIMVEVAVPGERWEVEFLDDGEVDVEIFKSDGTIHDSAVLSDLVAKHGDAAPVVAGGDPRPAPGGSQRPD